MKRCDAYKDLTIGILSSRLAPGIMGYGTVRQSSNAIPGEKNCLSVNDEYTSVDGLLATKGVLF